MKLAFCLLKYFPYGGQQRDFLKIAKTCLSRGNKVDVYTSSWIGDIPDGLDISILPVKGFTNHGRRESLAQLFKRASDDFDYDVKVGFIKMPDLDVYFAADSCFASKADERNRLYRFTPRCKSFLKMEEAVFGKKSDTMILLLSEKEKSEYIKYYETPEHRFHLLPPGISKDRLLPHNADQIRDNLRQELLIGPDEKFVLMIGSGFKTKGVDRAIHALFALPENLKRKTKLVIIGKDNPKPFIKLARRLSVIDRVHFSGGRDDVSRFLASADLLLHPAYRENTGTVLIEAMASQLPVLTTDVCGYSHYVKKAGAGIIIPSPFNQSLLNEGLQSMLTSDNIDYWKHAGGSFTASTDVFGLTEKAVDMIEKVSQ